MFATALYLAETFAEGSDDEVNLDCSGSIPVHDVFRAAWVIVATYVLRVPTLCREAAPTCCFLPVSILTSMTTVGYGDGFPVVRDCACVRAGWIDLLTILARTQTPAGKVVCMCAMMFGVLYMAMPIAIVGNNFYDLFKLRHKSHGCVGSISFAPGCTRRVDTHSGVRWSAQLQATRTRHAAGQAPCDHGHVHGTRSALGGAAVSA